jgi:predicted membrane protein
MCLENFFTERFVMTYNNPFSDRFFSQGHKTLTFGTLFFGGILFFLAILIFSYPALIAYFIAAVILLIGISALTVTWKLWQARKIFFNLEHWETPTSVDANEGIQTRIIPCRRRV